MHANKAHLPFEGYDLESCSQIASWLLFLQDVCFTKSRLFSLIRITRGTAEERLLVRATLHSHALAKHTNTTWMPWHRRGTQLTPNDGFAGLPLAPWAECVSHSICTHYHRCYRTLARLSKSRSLLSLPYFSVCHARCQRKVKHRHASYFSRDAPCITSAFRR